MFKPGSPAESVSRGLLEVWAQVSGRGELTWHGEGMEGRWVVEPGYGFIAH